MTDVLTKDAVQETRFLIEGMDCASCVMRIETSLKKLPGIDKATVNLATGEASVLYKPEVITTKNIKDRVDMVGYKAVDIPHDEVSTIAIEEDRQAATLIRRNKFLAALILTVPVFLISMFDVHFSGSDWLQLILSTPVLLWSGSVFFVGGYKEVRSGSPGMNTLVAVSTGTAYLYSVIVVLFPNLFVMHGAGAHTYFESA